MGSLPKEKAGVGSAMSDTTRELGGTLGVAIGGSALARSTPASSGRRWRHRRPARDGGGGQGVDRRRPRRGRRRRCPRRTAAGRRPQAFVDGLRADVLISAGVASPPPSWPPSSCPPGPQEPEPEPAGRQPIPPSAPARPTGDVMNPKLTATFLIAAAVLGLAAFTGLGAVFNYPDRAEGARRRRAPGRLPGVETAVAGGSWCWPWPPPVRRPSPSASAGSPRPGRCASPSARRDRRRRRAGRRPRCAGRCWCPATRPTPPARIPARRAPPWTPSTRLTASSAA